MKQHIVRHCVNDNAGAIYNEKTAYSEPFNKIRNHVRSRIDSI